MIMRAKSSKTDRLKVHAVAVSTVLTAIATVWAPAAAAPPLPEQDWARTEVRDDCAAYNPLRTAFFGDTHSHTRYSADAVLARTRNTVRDAYSFCKGGTVGLPPYDAFDVPARLATIDRPLDFVALTDHSEGFGEAVICLSPGYPGYDDPLCQNLRSTFNNAYVPTNPLPQSFIEFFTALTFPNPQRFEGICGAAPGYADCATEAGVVWQDIQDAAEENYDRTSACAFTSFVAYEWTGQTGSSDLHRNVIFRNAEVLPAPITYYDQWKREDLWAQLKSQCLDAPGGCDVLAISHNSNLSQGDDFGGRNSDGAQLTAEMATLRASLEPLIELTQNKGDSECRSGVIGTNDELCNYELLSRKTQIGASDWNQTFSPYSYARGALKNGLSIERRTGVNPYAVGFVGSTDTHNGTPGAVSEIDYGGFGAFGISDSEPAFLLAEATPPSKIQSNPGGLAVVWAEENSRDAIFSAMRRRETYSTTGTRPIVRSFAGHYPLDLCDSPDFVAEGYDQGVPMGGDIGPELGTKSPRFAIMAQKDPGTMGRPGTPLQRIQVIKGWIDDRSGETYEEVYDVAGDASNGADVNLQTCEETGPGFDTLCTVWEDRQFDATQKAFYYVRVLENPVCRWSQRLCNDQGVDCSDLGSVPAEFLECCSDLHPNTIQERASTSPIWYHPDRLGLTKGGVKFGKEANEDRLQLALLIPDAPADLDPAVNGLTFELRNAGSVWSATIPAGTMEVKKAGSSYSFKDKTGAISGITGLSVKIGKKGAAIKIKTGNIDLSALSETAQALSLDMTTASFSSTATRAWDYKSSKLSMRR